MAVSGYIINKQIFLERNKKIIIKQTYFLGKKQKDNNKTVWGWEKCTKYTPHKNPHNIYITTTTKKAFFKKYFWWNVDAMNWQPSPPHSYISSSISFFIFFQFNIPQSQFPQSTFCFNIYLKLCVVFFEFYGYG